ncbi:hypothetical protein KDW49_13910 [Burkholderia dolosa]|uniref:hypothetical protein n=1 Tax=Burkholderia dolosa TaxID=152500 RepID=UPI001BA18A40|nr:hypothetical protein [Burkholderia dolosa]MBR8301799.1 hypothetical protein [Burkholderia dolosa]MBY4830288.1 hypothetical protein [Burkholderia dolosa]
MPALLDDFGEWNTVAAIVFPPKSRGHSGVHGIDARVSAPLRRPLTGTIRASRAVPFR